MRVRKGEMHREKDRIDRAGFSAVYPISWFKFRVYILVPCIPIRSCGSPY